MNAPHYQRIKEHILTQIEQGLLVSHDRVPSENELAIQFDVSRMTARKALEALLATNVVTRIRGKGTFVRDLAASGSTMSVRNIAEEITALGHRYQARLLVLEERDPSAHIANLFELAPGEQVFYSSIVHCQNDRPLQWEQRYVKRSAIPEYLQQDFVLMTPNAYLSEVSPLQSASSTISAVSASEIAAENLEISAGTACLQIERITASRSGIVSLAELIYPGERYKLSADLDYS
ncbi:histidine utilization repressor [uncultured Umboniibacter sp.]|uniref:histidine utilization repressor n=1 Tax=uncultured Umboniibacter sp. TaxID=1798917 RepID=UPI00260F814F|nr:histidine utilization repressor [uncultured Umboniibacter sp.]